jgi:uncharacterized protein VirK/YbjX
MLQGYINEFRESKNIHEFQIINSLMRLPQHTTERFLDSLQKKKRMIPRYRHRMSSFKQYERQHLSTYNTCTVVLIIT